MNTSPIVKEVLVSASPGKVWKAITNKDDMKVWYFDLEDFKPEVGFEFQFYGETPEKKYLHLCKVTEVINHEKICYTWSYMGYEGESLITFEVIPEGDKTRLRLTHEGVHNFPSDNKDLKKENFIGGWEAIVCESFKHFVELEDAKMP